VRNSGGLIIAQSWPRPRGHAQSPRQQAWINRFACLARMRKSPFPQELDAANMWAQLGNALYANDPNGGLWYYRDVLESAAYGKLIRYQGQVRVTTPTASVKRATNQSVAGGAFVAMQPTAIDWDNNRFWDSTVNPTRLTVRSPGLYLVMATINLQTNNAGVFSCELAKNGGASFAGSKIPKNNTFTFANAVGLMYFNANDYVECKVFNSANTTNFQLLSFQIVAITPEAIV